MGKYGKIWNKPAPMTCVKLTGNIMQGYEKYVQRFLWENYEGKDTAPISKYQPKLAL